jgi:hypothetical protein
VVQNHWRFEKNSSRADEPKTPKRNFETQAKRKRNYHNKFAVGITKKWARETGNCGNRMHKEIACTNYEMRAPNQSTQKMSQRGSKFLAQLKKIHYNIMKSSISGTTAIKILRYLVGIMRNSLGESAQRERKDGRQLPAKGSFADGRKHKN